jgi:hypothetical protein
MKREGMKRAAIAAVITEDVARLNELAAFLRYRSGDPLSQRAERGAGWVSEADMAKLEEGPQAGLLAALERDGFGGNRRALSASILLRYGWSSGFLIGAYLVSHRVYEGADIALRFSQNSVLMEVAVRAAASVRAIELGDISARETLARELTARAAPIVEAHHQWSGFSRKALWAMVVSSFAAQFTHVAEKLENPEHGLIEADAVLRLMPETDEARPDLYLVRAEGRRGVCQMRRLCCLWFKGPKRQFCASCPILTDEERLLRNERWIADRGLPDLSPTQCESALTPS